MKTKGKLTYWYVGPTQASPPLDKIMYDQFWEAFGKTYPNITVEQVSLDYNQMLDKLRTAALGNAAPSVGAADAAVGPGVRGEGAAARAQAGGRRLQDRRTSGRRDEVGDLERQDLRRTDQQRDHGADLERADCSRTPASIRRQPPATWDDLVVVSRSRSRRRPARTATAWSPASMPATRRSASCRSSGPTAAARSTRRRQHPTYKTIMINNAGTQSSAAGVLRHVRARRIGADLGADQHADREPGSVHRRPARHDDQPSQRVRRHAGQARKRATGEDKQGRRRGGGQHALRADPAGSGAARRGVRWLELPHLQSRHRRRRAGPGRRQGASRHS